MMGVISLEGLAFFAHHGCSEEEQRVGGRYMIDIEITTNVANATIHDDINKTIDYSKVYAVVAKEMKISSQLLENIAKRIIDSVFIHFSKAQSVKVRVAKLIPPIGGICKSATIALEERRPSTPSPASKG